MCGFLILCYWSVNGRFSVLFVERLFFCWFQNVALVSETVPLLLKGLNSSWFFFTFHLQPSFFFLMVRGWFQDADYNRDFTPTNVTSSFYYDLACCRRTFWNSLELQLGHHLSPRKCPVFRSLSHRWDCDSPRGEPPSCSALWIITIPRRNVPWSAGIFPR